MRKITQQAVNAFLNCQTFSSGNTHTEVTSFAKESELDNITDLFLHGNLIAQRKQYKNGDTDILVSNAGWFTNTTKERLNGLPRVSVCQKKGKWYLNDTEWDGSWKKV